MLLQIILGSKSAKKNNTPKRWSMHNRTYFLLLAHHICILKVLFEFPTLSFLSVLCHNIHFGKRNVNKWRIGRVILVNQTLKINLIWNLWLMRAKLSLFEITDNFIIILFFFSYAYKKIGEERRNNGTPKTLLNFWTR